MIISHIEGDLIELAQTGKFDVVAHGCNCFCTMKRGIAPQMAKAFDCDNFELEKLMYKGDIRKLGNIDFKSIGTLTVVNIYSQYHFHDPSPTSGIPLDYDALRLAFRKMNILFAKQHIGLPKIGCGYAKGDWNKVQRIIEQELKDCNITVVTFPFRGKLSEIEHIKEIA